MKKQCARISILTILTLSLLLASGCTQGTNSNNGTPNQINTEESTDLQQPTEFNCDEIENSDDLLDCYNNFAISNEDIKLCNKFYDSPKLAEASQSIKETMVGRCKFVYVRVKNDSKLCEEITDDILYKAECYAYFAALENNPEYCNDAPESHIDWCKTNKMPSWKSQIQMCKSGQIQCKEGYQMVFN